MLNQPTKNIAEPLIRKPFALSIERQALIQALRTLDSDYSQANSESNTAMAAVFLLYKSLLTGNNPESIHIYDGSSYYEARVELETNVTAEEYLARMEHSLRESMNHAIAIEHIQEQDIVLCFSANAVEAANQKQRGLTVSFVEVGMDPQWVYEAWSPYWSDTKILHLHRRVATMADTIISQPDLRIRDIPALDEREASIVLQDFNRSDKHIPSGKTVVQLFEEQVQLNPCQIALQYKGHSLTYQELNERANGVAYDLIEHGVGPDSIVGLMAERSLEQIIGIYGILKAGGAYLPIDPELPPNRIHYMLANSETTLVLTGPGGEGGAESLQQLQLVDLTKFSNVNLVNPMPRARPEHLAYVIYTSGTTGNPKGVMVEHRNLLNLTLWMLEDDYSNQEVLLLKTTYAFDLSIWELFVGFLAGAAHILLPKEHEKEPHQIAALIQAHRVTRTSFVPSVLEQFLHTIDPRSIESLRRIQLSGEALPVELANRFNQLNQGKARLVNSYGPTETTVFATSYDVPADITLEHIHIGKPLANMKIYILNQDRLCGVGMLGEVCIGGAGVSRGYLNRPDLTAEKFVPNPYIPGERMYRTGDLARWMEDGSIEYLGRLDDQVKVRGYRIELREIASRLREIEGIQHAAVIAHEERGEKVLCGYVVSADGHELDITAVKQELSSHLPAYMIPTHLMQLEDLPVTRNGKLDKKALPKPEVKSKQPYEAPQDEMEAVIASMFQELLSVKLVGIHDSFSELGGHSLRATRLAHMMEKRFNVRLPLRTVLAADTVANLSACVRTAAPDMWENIKALPPQPYYEMSSTQKRLYLIHQLQENSLAYNIPMMYEADGDLDIERLRSALQQLCHQHELLRTYFTQIEDQFVQIVEDEVSLVLEEGHPAADVTRSSLVEDFVRPFDLAKAPLMRAKLIHAEDGKSLLLMDIHHIIYDEGSASVLMNDLTRLYNGESLEPLAIQYKDYSAWANSRDFSEQEAYWLERFQEDTSVLNIKTDYPRPKTQSYEGSSVMTELSPMLKPLVGDLAKKTGATEYMILLSVFMLLLSRYSRQAELIVGTPIAGRTHADTYDMLGMFVNTLAIKGEIKAEQSFESFVHDLKEQCMLAYENQDYPFEQLVEKVAIDRDLSRHPLFDVMFVMQNHEAQALSLGGTKLQAVHIDSIASTFDLTVSVEPQGEGYALKWEYCTALFKKETIERMSRHYEQFLLHALNEPHLNLDELSYVSQEERDIVVQSFNATDGFYPADKTLIQLFEEQVERTPNQIAVQFEKETLTYRELNDRANAMGQVLSDLGVKPDSIVALITGRSIEMIVGIFSILKAGGSYLPIDPAHPLERIRYMLTDSQAVAVLLGPGSDPVAPELQEHMQIDLRYTIGSIQVNPSPAAEPHHLAYVIYTSGTTGLPKAVMVEHRNVVNLSTWQIEYGQYQSGSMMIQKTTFVFDGSAWEIFPALLAGCTLQLLNEEQNQDPAALMKLLPNRQIALIPSNYRALLDYAETNQAACELKALERLYLAAEPITSELLEKHARITGTGYDNIHNLYGPTEATVTATAYRLDREGNGDSVPIGKPVLNTQVYILNAMELCGIGVPGELCIGGAGVARGYWNQPQLTAEKFVANPYRQGERMYRTGDLARWLPDGNLEYLGRIGEQVKIRGYRIELGEIESSLRDIEGVFDAAVIARQDQGEAFLCAYVVGKGELMLEKITEQLQSTLPSYMIPTHLMQLEKLPVTRNGKLDRKALPEPAQLSSKPYAAPRDATELGLVEIFQQVLACDAVGIDDSFYELGGHSLRATKLVNAIGKSFGVRLKLRDVLIEQTVRKLALRVRSNEKVSYDPIEVQPLLREVVMSPQQKSIYLVHQMQADQAHNRTYNIPFLVRSSQPIDYDRLKHALSKLADRHSLLRTSFIQEGSQYLQRIAEHAAIELETAESQREEISDLFDAFVRPFDLSKAPLMRVKAVRSVQGDTILMFDLHHIIFDEGSKYVLLEEISKLYNDESLPPVAVDYKDYSQWISSITLSEEEAYWAQVFEVEPPMLELTTDYPRPKEQTHIGSSLHSQIPSYVQSRVKAISRQTGATEYMVMLSAFMLLLSRYSRQADLVVGSPIAGRHHPDTQQMLGMFVNTLAIRGKLDAACSFEDWLAEMKETCLQAYEHQAYPFERLVERVATERDLSRHPLFDVVFAQQQSESSSLQLGAAGFEEVMQQSVASTFDLTVSMAENEDGYGLRWEYSTALFKQETIERMALHFEALLEDALSRPDVPLAELSMMTAQEQAQVMHVFNETEHPYPQGLTAIQLFESQAAAAPERTAVAFNGQELTYQELNARANEVGRRLRALGVGPDSIVGLVTGRSLEMIIGIYGILKAGGAYLPIDPAHPIDRIRYMLADSQAPAVLVGPGGEQVRELLFDLAEVIDLAEAGQGSPHEQEPHGNLEPLAEPHHLAYVIYTSGTTGQPKGVMIENRSLVHLAEWQRVEGEMNEHSVMLQKSTYIFDAAVWEIFSSTLTGAKLMMATESENEDPELLLNLIQQHKVTDALIVPSAFRMLLDYAEVHGKEEALRAFKRIYLGAEPVTPDLLERYVRITGHGVERLTNLYGPTEATVCVTSLRFQPKARYDSIPIGKPLWNTQIYVMNGDSLCGIGVPGELCVGGAGLARGYLNQQELTAEKFVKHPYQAGERLYRTGDLARWSAEGSLEYLGRIGEQVKIRGFRIELGEIESRLREIQGVQDAVVTVREDQGEAMLCGYVVSSAPLDLSKTKEQLAVHLPSYMIPAHLMQVELLPLTRSGKVDRKALPEPERVQSDSYTAPRDEMEQLLVDAFQDILGVNPIGIDDSFFDLGGHSLRAARLMSLLDRNFGHRLSLREILEEKTVRNIAQHLKMKQASPQPEPMLMQLAVAVEEEV
ncbi:non-ribosomal peptide synthetase [Paenibacillus aquistagni]|uniref:non-ribosomal peptide synthetase n=1 Tax=Paenibacillus aquistagni TaxID=1852522 RepID=UPI000B507B23|nr:non-ribosomal peptide synthetase [Paenibacillus aquistagni]